MTQNTPALLLFLILLFATPNPYNAQEKQIDSVNTVLLKIKSDEAREKKLDSLINYELKYVDSKIHIYFIEKAIVEGVAKKDNKRLADAYLAKSKWFDSQMKIDSSLYYGNESLRQATLSKDSISMLASWRNLGNIEVSNGNYTNALDYFNSVLSYCDRNGLVDNREKLLTQFNLGGLYYNIDEYDKAIPIYEYLYNHPQVKEDINWRNETGLNYTMVLFMTENYEPMLSLAKELEASESRQGMLSYIYGMLSGANLGLKKFNEAIRYNEKAVSLFEEMGDSLAVFSGKLMTGDIRVDMGQYDEAERIFLEADKKLKASIDPPVMYIENVYGALSRVYRGKGDYKKAVEYTDKLYKFRDSLKGIEKQNVISELEIKYDTEKTKREKQEAEAQTILVKEKNARQRNLLIGLVLIAGLLLLSGLLYFSRLKAKKKAEIVTLELKETQKRLALEKQYRDSELKALKAQMNPHFIFNALNSIQEYIILNQKNLAGDYLGTFADLMRKYLHHSDAGSLTVQDEIDSLEMYLELEALRFEDTLTYKFVVAQNIQTENVYIPTMLIQPYVENALKHGLLHRKENRKLSIHFTLRSSNTIVCSIEDNGVGRTRSAEIKAQLDKTHTSFATKATENRLNLLNYQKDKKIGVVTIDLFDDKGDAKGTKVILNIPTVSK